MAGKRAKHMRYLQEVQERQKRKREELPSVKEWGNTPWKNNVGMSLF